MLVQNEIQDRIDRYEGLTPDQLHEEGYLQKVEGRENRLLRGH